MGLDQNKYCCFCSHQNWCCHTSWHFCRVNSSTNYDTVLSPITNNWLLSGRMSHQSWQENPATSSRVVRGSLFTANQGTCIPLLDVLLSNYPKQHITNPEQKNICSNKISNAFPMANHMCCENDAALESFSWGHNLDNYQNKVIEVFRHDGQNFQDQISLFHCYHNKNLQIYLYILWNNICCFVWQKENVCVFELASSCTGNSAWGYEEIQNIFLNMSYEYGGQGWILISVYLGCNTILGWRTLKC